MNSIESSSTTGAAVPPDRGVGAEDASNPERKYSETPDVSMMSEPESRAEDDATSAAATASGPASFDGAATSTPRTEHMDNQENLPQTPQRLVPQTGDSTPVVTTEPVAGTSGTCAIAPSNNTDYAVILGMDVRDLPDGVDPSFLAALPDDMRQEVIDEQRRLQNIRQQAAQQQEQQGMQEVNPEFLAALPPNIQEEVLAQQRIEQQRQAAATANPGAPPAEFLQSLPAPLRQSVLADMEESQMSALPANLAEEAQSLRREYEMRTRAMMNEQFFSHATHGSLSSILRNTVRGLGSQYAINSLGGGSRDPWRNSLARAGAGGYPQSLLAAANERFKGRQLLDYEGLSCLLILLFIDDAKINTTRLHRILRNLCYHTPTRDWVVNSLLSILDKSNESKPTQEIQNSLYSSDMPPAAKVRKSTSSSKSSECASSAAATSAKTEKAPSWLSVSMDAALGFRANVFQVNRLATGKKSSNATSAERSSCISIHPGASTVVCKHTLEVLISLAKSFPGHFLPWKGLEASSKEPDKSIGKEYKLTSSTPTSANKGENKKAGSSNSASAENNSCTIPEFWETLLKLDIQSTSKKGKSMARSHSSVINLKSGEDEDANGSFNFESSPFGNLLAMLASPVIRRSSVLTDKLLRLLSLISVAEDQMKKTADNDTSAESASKAASQKRSLIAADHLRP